MTRLPGPSRPSLQSLRRELPALAGALALLVVLLHANAPEVWFWFAALVVLLLWRSLACRARWRGESGAVGTDD